MHVVMFGDQHVESLGGAQVSMRLQRRFLERAGHTVTIVAPRMHGARTRALSRTAAGAPDVAAYVDTPSIAITLDREYSLTWPGRRADRFVDAAMASRPPVDVVHVQADFWGAFTGHRFAARHGLPVVHTMHNRVDVGIEATAPFPRLVLRVLNAWQRRALRAASDNRGSGRNSDAAGTTIREAADSPKSGHDGWAYLRRFGALSRAVTAPSTHFARRLERHDVAPLVDVVWNGIDDDVLDAVDPAGAGRGASDGRRASDDGDAPADGEQRIIGPDEDDAETEVLASTEFPLPRRPRLVWLGRMSPEKRLLPFLKALAESGIDADVEIIGGGGQEKAARRLVERLQLDAEPAVSERRRSHVSVTFAGRLPYAETLRRIARADAVVQTSIGFETQGMTVFEAASLGTPAIVSDPDIAAELGSGFWLVGDGSRADASVAALAATLREAAKEIGAGTPAVPDPSIGERFRQSSRTAAMVAVYRRAIG